MKDKLEIIVEDLEDLINTVDDINYTEVNNVEEKTIFIADKINVLIKELEEIINEQD